MEGLDSPFETPEEEREVARVFAALRPALRAPSMYSLFCRYCQEGDVDLFVWRYRAFIPATIEAFKAVGARKSARLLARLVLSLVAQSEGVGERDGPAAEAFLAFRNSLGGPAAVGWLDFDPTKELGDAILLHAQAHPKDFLEDS